MMTGMIVVANPCTKLTFNITCTNSLSSMLISTVSSSVFLDEKECINLPNLSSLVYSSSSSLPNFGTGSHSPSCIPHQYFSLIFRFLPILSIVDTGASLVQLVDYSKSFVLVHLFHISYPIK